jgi:hypothetical protein
MRRSKKRPKQTPHDVYLEVKDYLESEFVGTKRKPPRLVDKNQNLGALGHSRPALEVRAPAFFRHAIFFFPHDPLERDPLLHPGAFNRDLAMKRLGELLKTIVGDQSDKIGAELKASFEKDDSYVLNAGSFIGFDMRAVVDIYSEFASLTLMLDNHESLSKMPACGDPAHINEYIQLEIDNRKAAISKAECEEWFEENYLPAEIVFFGIWELFNNHKRVRPPTTKPKFIRELGANGSSPKNDRQIQCPARTICIEIAPPDMFSSDTISFPVILINSSKLTSRLPGKTVFLLSHPFR